MKTKEIADYSKRHYVTRDGRVFRKHEVITRNDGVKLTFKEKEVKQRENEFGYMIVSIDKKVRKVHRMVAIAFLGKKDGLDVNHKDGDKKNNNISNLEWVTRSENIKHSYDIGLREDHLAKISKKIEMLDSKGNVIKTFNSISDANEYLGVDKRTSVIGKICKGVKGHRTYYGSYWRFKDEN
ncbi:TPA: HNH endonuclease [Bacillus cereus biovar anthracis]|nr:HNH endonuclease [Bacillus cereus biovar anthracis]